MDSPRHDRFPTTRWYLLGKVTSKCPLERREALSELLNLYSGPIRNFVASRRGVRASEVDDIVHDFVTLKWLEQDFLSKATPERGRFRWFLIVSLGRFVSNWLRDASSQRHRVEDISVNDLVGEDEHVSQFERDWAKLVLDSALVRFRTECTDNGRPDIWDVFEARILRPCLQHEEPMPYADLIARHGFKSPAQAQNVLITAKRGFLRAIKETVATYETDPAAQESEISDLLRILKKE
jgi:hypothetical protein